MYFKNIFHKFGKISIFMKLISLARATGVFESFSRCRTPTVDGMSFRRCLSGGGDIFSKSVERQGGANRTFATGGCCHGWQLEPCPCGLEPLLTFRQKIPTGRPYIEEGCSVHVGVRSFLTNSQVTLTRFAGIARLCYIKFILEK